MNNKPVISVIMSTYNTPNEWLIQSIESILAQTYTDFEFLIADDCSTTDISAVKEMFDDERLIWVKNENNLGLTKTLNKLMKMARGKYIARMDADDISLPGRFKEQVRFMDKHKDIIVCGSDILLFGYEEKEWVWNLPNNREEQRARLFFRNEGVPHPTAMLRKSMLDDYNIKYNESHIKSQDYGMWIQCTQYAPMAVIPKVLLKYRESRKQISRASKGDQIRIVEQIVLEQLSKLNIDASPEEERMHLCFCRDEAYGTAAEIHKWLEKLIYANNVLGCYDAKIFKRLIEVKWYDLCKKECLNGHNEEFGEEYKKARDLNVIAYKIMFKIRNNLKPNRIYRRLLK